MEIKAVESLERIHTAQMLTYLRVTGIRVGLVMNFNSETLVKGPKRIVLQLCGSVSLWPVSRAITKSAAVERQ